MGTGSTLRVAQTQSDKGDNLHTVVDQGWIDICADCGEPIEVGEVVDTVGGAWRHELGCELS